jgi:hypothetical protein
MFFRLGLGIIAMSVSFYFSWVFIVGDANGITAILIAAAFVIVSEGSKIILFSDGLYHARYGNAEWGFTALFISSVLIGYSITATAFNFTLSAEPYRQAQKSHDYTLEQLENVRLRIDTANKNIEFCNNSGWFSKCVEPEQAELSALLKRESSLLLELKELQKKTGAGIFWQRLGGDTAQGIFHFSRGFILEILGLIMLATGIAEMRINKGVRASMPTLLGVQPMGPPKPTTPLSGSQNDAKSEAKSVDDWVTHLSNVGIKNPSIAQLKGFGMGQEKAQKVRDKLKGVKS